MSSALYCVEGVLELDEMVRVVLIKWKADAVLGIVFYDCQRATKWKRSQFSKSYPIEVKAVQQVLELAVVKQDTREFLGAVGRAYIAAESSRGVPAV